MLVVLFLSEGICRGYREGRGVFRERHIKRKGRGRERGQTKRTEGIAID